jgi:hypothetical protein
MTAPNVRNPISPKFWAALVGSGAGTVVSTLLIWLLGASVFGGGWSAERVNDAIASVPTPLAGFILLLVTIGMTIAAVYAKSDPQRLATLDPDLAHRHLAIGSPYREEALK